MGITDKVIDRRDTPGSENDTGTAPPSYFGFNSTGKKGNKGGKVSSEEGRKDLKTPSRKTNKDGQCGSLGCQDSLQIILDIFLQESQLAPHKLCLLQPRV